MAPSYKDWKVSGYLRPVMEQSLHGEWITSYEQERVCVISNPSEWLWEVVVDAGRIKSLTLQPRPGVTITQRKLSAVPLGYLRDVTESFWREVDRGLADMPGAVNVTPVSAAILAAGGEAEPFTGKPTPEEFASLWNATPARRFDRKKKVWITRRDALRLLFRRPNGTAVSLATIDTWTRDARDRGLIEAAKTGKPRETKTTGTAPGTKKGTK